MVALVQNDLEFILRQIKIAEAHATGIPLTQIRVDAAGNVVSSLDGDGNVIPGDGTLAISQPLVPNGLRTVDGSYNNLIEGREQWGSSNQPFINILDRQYRNEGDDVFYTPNNNYGIEGSVADADPRIISNLIVDQTISNPAAISAGLSHYTGLTGAALLNAVNAAMAIEDLELRKANLAAQGVEFETSTAGGITAHTISLPNVAPDEGLSAPYNSWFTLFGQFFDHGLDLVKKGGSGTVYIPLQQDDPLYNKGVDGQAGTADDPPTNFMALTRIDQDAPNNVTTPFVDQNQTYTSHASHQVFLREYAMTDDGPVATGRLLEGARGLATWADVKQQAREMLGINLTDADVGAVPLLRTDPYGEFIRGADGYPMVVKGVGPDGVPNTDDDITESWDGVSGLVSLTGALRLPNAFLDDIAHNAVPVLNAGVLVPDGDSAVGYSGGVNPMGQNTAYDNETLDAHYITGDGRGNENIGLSAVHHIFHSEHNRVVDQVREAALASGDLAFLNEWLLSDAGSIPAFHYDESSELSLTEQIDALGLSWDGERLFQAARFTTEMQYQHLVFEEFARKVQPDVDAFVFNPSMDINPAIFAEFAHVVYRFGHSMLNQTVDSIDANGTLTQTDLFTAFLNPLSFGSDTITHDQAAGAIARGMTAQVGNEIDEFVTHVLRNQLVGIPLDLAALNIARARDAGIPALNEARRQFQEIAQGDTQLDAYTSWSDFAVNLKNPASIVNFIAAYGTHTTITGATTLEAKRDAAMALVFGGTGAPADRLDFINAKGAYAGGSLGGLENIDLWVGGLAEKKMAFGGMLGSTFSFIFELQLENLQNGDRFYYLSRVQGLNLLNELENNSLAKMVLNNTDSGELDIAMPGDIFSTPNYVLYVDAEKQEKFGTKAADEPEHDDPWLAAMLGDIIERGDFGAGERYIRYNGNDHVVIGGTDDADTIISGGGDDAVWGFDGDDRIEAGYGVDKIHGGKGDDIITNNGTDIGEVDMLHGEEGNDVIHGGSGLALIFGNQGNDAIFTGPDGKEAFGGTGDDFILGGEGGDNLLGNEGDDWIEGGNGFDVISGDNSQLFFNSDIIGHDVMFAGQNEQDFDAESGDDIMVQGESVIRNEGMWGYDWGIHKGFSRGADADLLVPIFTTDEEDILRNRFDQVEGLSGSDHGDVLRGDHRTNQNEVEAPEDAEDRDGVETRLDNNELTHEGVDRIAGLRTLLGDLIEAAPPGADTVAFESGNILLGGGGADTIEGRGGDDVIDGDAWLNVRIAVDGHSTITTVESLAQIQSHLLRGEINPSQLSIVREILYAQSLGDIAVFSGDRDEYEVTLNDDGSFTVSHDGGDGADGTDRVRNIEILRFADGDSIIGGATEGLPLNDLTPTEGQALAVTLSDPDGIVSSTVTWEVETAPGVWTLMETDSGFTPSQQEVGLRLRVNASYTDSLGISTTYAPVITAVVGDDYIGTNGIDTPSLTEGADYVRVLGQSDIVVGLGGDDTMLGGAGHDSMLGGAGNDSLLGEAGGDTIDGGAGADTMSGGVGNDVFFVDDAGDLVIEAAGEGTDVVRTTLTTYTLTDNVENLAYLGSEDFFGTGNALANVINGGTGHNTLVGLDGNDRLNGMGGNDSLVGGGGADTLVGSVGDDTLDGGLGADYLAGGMGSDYYLVDNVGDTVVDGGTGTDTVATSLNTYALGGSIEALVFTGTGDFIGTGNTLANTMKGGAGNDNLSGGGGADTLEGGAGNDIMNGGAGRDVFIFGDGFGNDVINGFGAAAGASQDLLDVSGLGITAAQFNTAALTVTALTPTRTEIAFGGGTVTLEGIASGSISAADFIFAV